MKATVIIDRETRNSGHVLKDCFDVKGDNAEDILNSKNVQRAIKKAYGNKLVAHIIFKGSNRDKDGIFEVTKKSQKLIYIQRNEATN